MRKLCVRENATAFVVGFQPVTPKRVTALLVGIFSPTSNNVTRMCLVYSQISLNSKTPEIFCRKFGAEVVYTLEQTTFLPCKTFLRIV